MGINARKPVFGVSDHAWLDQTNKLKNAEFVRVASHQLKFPESEQQRHWSNYADAQAGLRLCFSHAVTSGFLTTWPITLFHTSEVSWNTKEPNREKKNGYGGGGAYSAKKWYYVLSIREKCLSTDRVEDLGRPRILMHSKRNMNGHICERKILVPTTKVKDFSVYITSLITTKLNSLLLAMQRESCFNISSKFGCDPLIHATCPWCHKKPIYLSEFR